jgi:AcrR family transcriptional regulator
VGSLVMSTELARATRGGRTRSSLIVAGRRLFSERAIDAVSIDEIVQAANVAKGTFYNHFTDRDALADAISAEIRASVESAIDLANAHVEDPAMRVARAVSTYFRFALDDTESAGFLIRVHSARTSLSAPLNGGVVGDISRGLREGRFAIPTVEAGMLCVLGVTTLALVRMLSEPQPALVVSLAQQVNSLLLRALGISANEADLVAAQASEDIVRVGSLSEFLPRALPQ